MTKLAVKSNWSKLPTFSIANRNTLIDFVICQIQDEIYFKAVASTAMYYITVKGICSPLILNARQAPQF